MTPESAHKKLLEKILNSKEFNHSQIYQNYLTYLVESANEGKQLKEITIAIEVFGKDSSFNPAEDTIVRSHTYTLRKKLESYYYNEGKEDKYRLRIPKGHYETKFIPVQDNLHRTRRFLLKLTAHYYSILIILVLCALLAVLWSSNSALRMKLAAYRVMDPKDPVWAEFLDPDKTVMIIIGDHFFFTDYSDKYQEFIGMRHPKVNSMEDLEVYRARHPEIKLEVTDEPYFPYHAIWSLPPVLNMLYAVHKKPIIRKSSDVSPQILDEYNIIFLGSIKTMYKLKHTLLKSHFDFEIAPHKIIYTPPDTGSVQVFETTLHSPGPNEDLVLALKLPGPNQKSIFIIASFHSLGAPEIANYLTTPALREALDIKFQERYGRIPEYFEILFRVTGIDKTAYSKEVLIFNKIEIG